MKVTRSKSKKDDQDLRLQAVALIGRVADLCTSNLPLSEALEELLKTLHTAARFDAATLFLFDDTRSKMTIGASIGPAIVDVLGFLPLGPGHGLSGWVATHDKPVLLADRSNTAGFDSEHDFASVAALPLKTSDTILGVLNIGCRRPGLLNPRQVDALGTVTGLLGLAVECLTGRHTIEAMRQELQRSKNEQAPPPPAAPSSERLADIQQLSGAIYHEINDALAVIVGNADCFLAEQTVLDQKTVSRVRRIHEAALKIRSMNQKLPGLESMTEVRRSYDKSGS